MHRKRETVRVCDRQGSIADGKRPYATAREIGRSAGVSAIWTIAREHRKNIAGRDACIPNIAGETHASPAK